MQKSILFIATVLLIVSLTACDSNPISDNVTNKENVVWTFVDYDENDIPWDETIEKDVPEFKSTKFQCGPGKLAGEFAAIKDNKKTVLFMGMPIINVFVTDINDDGMPEFCATKYCGSGIVDSRVVVVDYANNEYYDVSDRMKFDYSLSKQDEKLIITRSSWEGKGDENGRLLIKNHQLIIEYANGEIKTVEAIPQPNEQDLLYF